jgi:aryl-alcohol dehydrogenase-like predicted oxidoreductase
MRYVTEEDRTGYARLDMAVTPYSATANGYFASGGERGRSFQNPENEARLQRAQQLAAELGATPGQVALAYLMNQGFLVVPIVGTTNPEHLRDSMGADRLALTPEQVAWLRDG